MNEKETPKLNKFAQAKITKVVVNIGIGRISGDKKAISQTEKDITKITGQKGIMRQAKKSIAGFKLREGMLVGYMVTLRGKRMNDFISRLVNIAIPRIRDFKGLSNKGFDQQGNYNLGIKEHIIFPEINYDEVDKTYGFNITVCTSAKTNEDALNLLKTTGFPFKES